MKAVIDVATPVMVRTPLDISSMYTPGYVRDKGICKFLLISTVLKAGSSNVQPNSHAKGAHQ
ncbi:MAG TPA: hypothetical protein PLN19_07650, partial [Methanothrix sp.]|nr:hypothetical protein [Methanothrix sp.]